MFYKSTNIYKAKTISNDIVFHVNNLLPFSIVRLGDGDLKIVRWMKIVKTGKADYEDFDKVKEKLILKSIKQGIRENFYDALMSIYKDSCNEANYITSFDHWYSKVYWKKYIGSITDKMLRDWKKWYEYIGITNTNYCSPDISYHLFLKNRNLLNRIKNRKICLISGIDNHVNILRKNGFNASLIKIPSIGEEGSKNPRKVWHSDEYENILEKISDCVHKFDIFFVGAGAIGRGYSMWIRRWGGIAIDIGRVMESWAYKEMPNRIDRFMKMSGDLSFDFTIEGSGYEI